MFTSEEAIQRLLFRERTPRGRGLKRQEKILKECIRSGINLGEALRERGLSYDDLRYVESHKPSFPKQRYLKLSDFREKEIGIPVISFFSGAGGLDLGLEAAGFVHTLLIEKAPLFCETLKSNRPGWKIYSGDVSDKDEMVEVISKAIGKKTSFDGMFVGGPPCQPFSIAANQRFAKNGKNFKRVGFSHATNGNLLFDYIELIKLFRPRAFLIENVPGLLEIDGGEQLKEACNKLEASGYNINRPTIIRADLYKVPQQRSRLFIIGSRTKRKFDAPSSDGVPLACGSVFDLRIEGVENHVTREHFAVSILRYMQLPYGGREKLGRVDRLDPRKPSKTIIAGGTSGGGRSHLHPYIPRTLSVRECARLQTFPDDFIFQGPVARQFTQVGNAVPPVLAAQIAASLKKSFFG